MRARPVEVNPSFQRSQQQMDVWSLEQHADLYMLRKRYASARDVEGTLQHLRNALAQGFPRLLKALNGDVFEFLSNEPQFQGILAEAEAFERTTAGQALPASSQPAQ
jgi:hypothetical protein